MKARPRLASARASLAFGSIMSASSLARATAADMGAGSPHVAVPDAATAPAEPATNQVGEANLSRRSAAAPREPKLMAGVGSRDATGAKREVSWRIGSPQ